MKTTYITPEMNITTVETQQMVCTSTPGMVENGSADTSSEQEGGGYQLSRGFDSLWDDEE